MWNLDLECRIEPSMSHPNFWSVGWTSRSSQMLPSPQLAISDLKHVQKTVLQRLLKTFSNCWLQHASTHKARCGIARIWAEQLSYFELCRKLTKPYIKPCKSTKGQQTSYKFDITSTMLLALILYWGYFGFLRWKLLRTWLYFDLILLRGSLQFWEYDLSYASVPFVQFLQHLVEWMS